MRRRRAGSPGSRSTPCHPACPSARRIAAPVARRTPAPSPIASSTRAGACRAGTARPAARRAGSRALLRHLNPVAVRIVDVEQPHRPMELEHRPDLDLRIRKPLALPFDVLDVDRRDRALLRLGLALRQRDLRALTIERRPALLVVDERLREPEQIPIERARRAQVPNPVPDSHSIKPGSSKSSFTSWRNSAAGAPSTAR